MTFLTFLDPIRDFDAIALPPYPFSYNRPSFTYGIRPYADDRI